MLSQYVENRMKLSMGKNRMKLFGQDKFFPLLLSILLVGALAGCGEKEKCDPKEFDSAKDSSDSWETVQVLKEEWRGFDLSEQGEDTWHPESCLDGLCPIPSLEWTRYQSLCAWSEDRIYHVSENCREGLTDTEDYEYCTVLEIVDTITGESERVEVSLRDAGDQAQETDLSEAFEELNQAFRKGFAKVISLDVLDGKIYLFVGQLDKEFALLHYYLIVMTKDCEVLDLSDLAGENENLKISSSDGIFDGVTQKEFELPLGGITRNGEVCLVKKDGSMYLIGREGVRYLEPLVSDIIEGSVTIIGKAEDGTLVFTALHGSGNTCFFTPEKLLFDCKSYLCQANLDETGGMLMWVGDHLIRWNVISGDTEVLCGMAGLISSDCKGIWKNSEDRLIIAFDDGEELCYYRYAPGKAKQEKIQIAAYVSNNYLKQCAAEYERTHPGVSVEFVDMESPWQNATVLNRLAEECKAGNGPDMMILNAQQMSVLQSAGSLKKLDGTLSEEILKGVFDSALKVGTIESGLYGIPCGLNLRCFFVAKENYDQGSWTLQELMNCMEECHQKRTKMTSLLCSSYQVDPQDLLYELCLQSIMDMPFVNMPERKCNFDSEVFYRLLCFCKAFADHEPKGENFKKTEEKASQMREGSALCYLFEGGLMAYSQVRSALGEEFEPVGVPSESGNGYLVTAYHLIMVNVFSEKQELVADFLNEVLSERYQIKYGSDDWVREDVLRDCVREHVVHLDEKGRERTEAVFMISSRGGISLAVDASGDSFVEEYIALMNRALPPTDVYVLISIISEEADAYFGGAKSEREVAEIIDRRVRLFLQE